jgi:hypothetical protein
MQRQAHFFGSLERVRIDEGITINLPGRPDLSTTTTEKTRVWTTAVRFDHQINTANTDSVRWLREHSPQFNQIIGDVSLDPAREESLCVTSALSAADLVCSTTGLTSSSSAVSTRTASSRARLRATSRSRAPIRILAKDSSRLIRSWPTARSSTEPRRTGDTVRSARVRDDPPALQQDRGLTLHQPSLAPELLAGVPGRQSCGSEME